MTPEEKSLLERVHGLVEENNAMLHSIKRSSRISSMIRIAYWVIILGLSFGAYYLIQPYVTTMFSLYDQAQKSFSGITNDVNSVQGAVNSLKDLLK